jgi:hypothetical protein
MRAITPAITSTGCGTYFIAMLLNSVYVSAGWNPDDGVRQDV